MQIQLNYGFCFKYGQKLPQKILPQFSFSMLIDNQKTIA